MKLAEGTKIAIGSDHAAFEAKALLVEHLRGLGYEVLDLGPDSAARCDYPDYAARVARAVRAGKATRGVLLCGTGIGISIAANKIPGIRAALAHDPLTAALARQHNDAHILCLGGRLLGPLALTASVDAFLAAEFEGGRHADRLALIDALDERVKG
ncbi:ribose 5-phosphate isomerase B [Myxococcota bacterium]|nr:ribose 5-phosphate isomerase B [Myxococcota bacterium]